MLLQNQYYMLTHNYDGMVNDISMISSNEIVEMSKKIKSQKVIGVRSFFLASSGMGDQPAHRGVMQADMVSDLFLRVSAMAVPWLFTIMAS